MNEDSLSMGVISPFESMVMHCTMTYGGDGGDEGGAEGGGSDGSGDGGGAGGGELGGDG